MIKAPTDNNEYQLLHAPNGIKILHVEDPQTEFCAFAVTVAAGNFSDPRHCPGLAHLLEHVLFTGSQHYPEDNHIIQFLDSHQGKINAWTSAESTTFYFKVHHKYFSETLDIFFDMLQSPLLSEAGIKKEIKAINAEFHNKVTEEQRRVMEVQKETCNPAHPFHQFAVGNNETFAQFSTQELQQLLRDYWRQHFVACNIAVCAITNTANSALVPKLVEQVSRFEKGTPCRKKDSGTPLYLAKQLGRHIQINTARPHHRLVLIFNQTPDLADARNIETLVSHLFGYEGHGSLLRLWKSQQWATQVLAGPGLKGTGFADFNLYIELTEKGMEHIQAIIASVFHFCQIIKNTDDIERHYAEKSRLNRIAFEHQTGQHILDLVQQLVTNVQRYTEHEVLCGDYLLGDLNKAELQQFLANINPERMRVISISNRHTATHSSKWYQVAYQDRPWHMEAVPQQLESLFDKELALPGVNPFIPDIKPVQKPLNQLPVKASKEQHNIWYGTDTLESGLKGECFFSWRSSHLNPDINKVAQRKLYASALESSLHNSFYQAQLAGLHFHFYAHQRGIGLHTSGFADKQLDLVRQLIQRICAAPQPCPDFELHKQDYLNSLHSSIHNKPLNRLFTVLQAIFVKASWLPEDLANIVQNLTLKDIQTKHTELFSAYQLESLLYGCWDESALSGFVDSLQLPTRIPEERTQASVVMLQDIEQRSFRFACEHQDAAIVLYLQTADKSLKTRALMMLSESILAGFYFDWMRNKKQLGYQVGTGYMPFNEQPGTVLFIQSPNASADELYQETLNALIQFHQWLTAIDEPQWLKYRKNLERQISQKTINFPQKCQRYWSAIARPQVDFQHELHLNHEIARLSQADIVQWFGQQFLHKNSHFVLYSPGKQSSATTSFEKPLHTIYQHK